MAARTFRFQLLNPTSIEQLKDELNDPTVVTDNAVGGPVMDITADETSEDDLVGALRERGYELLEVFVPPADPTTEVAYNRDSHLGVAQLGQVMYAAEGPDMAPETPVTSEAGWLVNDDGILIVF